MADADIKSVREMDSARLKEELGKLKKEQFNLRFQRATGQLENTSRVRAVRRDIARLKTVANQKRAGAEPAAKAKTATKASPKKKAAKAKPE